MKKILSVIASVFTVVFLLITTASAAALPKPTTDFFVNDFANVISNADEKKMQQQGEALYKACGAQVVVVTVKSLDGEDLEDYSLELARSWGIGSKNENDGVLLLLSVDDRQVRIEVGYGLEGALPDSKTGRILDIYGVPSFKEDDFSKGLASVYNSLINEVSIEKGLETSEGYTSIEEYDEDLEPTLLEKIVGYSIITIVVILVIYFSFIRRNGRSGYNDTNFPHGGGFGGFSGGSSGGGGFSGGGGSFGGGGSSRGF